MTLTLDEAPITRLYRRLCVCNPIPNRFQAWEDGAPSRNVPLTRIIGGPAFRSAGDHLLQLARQRLGPRAGSRKGTRRRGQESQSAPATTRPLPTLQPLTGA